MPVYVNATKEGTISGDSQFMSSEYGLLSNTNTFDMEALDKTLDYLATKNFWALYRNQKTRIQMDRFDIPISLFKTEYRTSYEVVNHMYSRRYMYYVDRAFVHYSQENVYRRSELYKKAINQEVIGKHPEIFAWNFLVFVKGELVTTCEVLPLEARTGVIIDLESTADNHGVSFSQFEQWEKDNVKVTIIFVPNYEFTDSIRISMKHLKTLDNVIPYYFVSNIAENDMDFSIMKSDSLVFYNSPGDYHVKWLSNNVRIYPKDEQIVVGGSMTEFKGLTSLDLSFINFNPEYVTKYTVKGREPYLRLKTKMPCPKDQLLVFVASNDGHIRFGYNITINEYYHNIYEFVGLAANETAYVYVFYTEKGVEQSETYFNQIAIYEEHYDLMTQYVYKSIPDIVKNVKPFEYKYDELDYLGYHTDVTPAVHSYKIDKLRNAIEEDPWSLWAYLIFLKLNVGKLFVFMDNIISTDRIRNNTTKESIDTHNNDIYFSEPHYLFSINKSFLTGVQFELRLFLDGLFLTNDSYIVRAGRDYYYIYIPQRLVHEDSVLEIERYRRYEFSREKVFISTMDKYVLESDAELTKTICVNDIYLVDLSTGLYLPKDAYVVSIDTMFVNSKKEITQGFRDTATNSFSHIGKECHIRIKDKSFINKRILIGIHRKSDMVHSKVYEEEPFSRNSYATMYIKNEGNYEKSNYRVFNNGRFCIPQQYQVIDRNPGVFGGTHEVRTLVAVKKGDRLTIDHVPANFRMIYYQEEIDSDGYVDLDGAVNLPISLRWYDIYLNGYRLHPRNIKIISPTRFYIKGVNTRKNLVIMDRDRNDDVFFLQPHYVYDDRDDDKNNTIIDDIFDNTNLRDKIKPPVPIPPGDDDIVDPIIDPDSIDMIVFFEEYMRYTHIDCNLRQLANKQLKEDYRMIFNDKGVVHINANNHPDGKYILKINCNEREVTSNGN